MGTHFKVPTLGSRNALLLETWAKALALEVGAVRRCYDHGHLVDACDPDLWDRVEQLATDHPAAGLSPFATLQAVRAFRATFGDCCPEC